MELEAVKVRDCACPGSPHADGDEVYLVPKIGIEGGAAAQMDLLSAQAEANPSTWLIARWTATFVRYGAVGWNWLRINEDTGRHEPVPFDVQVLLDDFALAEPVAARANELYQEQFLGPLLEAAGTTLDSEAAKLNRQQRRSKARSPRGRTGPSTSAPRASPSKPSGSSSEPDTDGARLRAVR